MKQKQRFERESLIPIPDSTLAARDAVGVLEEHSAIGEGGMVTRVFLGKDVAGAGFWRGQDDVNNTNS